jgi:6-phosphogluconolactonase
MKNRFIDFFVILIIILFSTSCKNRSIHFFAGTYTESGGKGLCAFNLNYNTGTFNMLSESDAGPNPSYFCISAKNGLIYAANEVMEFNGSKGGGVTTLKSDPVTGIPEKVNQLLVPYGGPCFISLSPAEDYLLMANYSSSSVAVVKLDDNGIPQEVTDTISFMGEEGKISHPHMISFGPGGRKVYLTDLGLDRISIYDFDAGHLKQISDGIVNMAPGSGPRHFVFSSDGSKMYVICELNSTISVFDVAVSGALLPVQTLSTLGEGFIGESNCADIHLGKNGQYLYGSNRGENTIVVFRTGSDGHLTLEGRTSCGGNWPRNFVIDPSGKILLVGNQKSGNISLFRISEKNGMPEYSDEYNLSSPACLKF